MVEITRRHSLSKLYFSGKVLHLLGLDHTHLTVRHQGRDYRLTDVHGNVIRSVIA